MRQKLRVVFVESETAENVGFIARTMKNFGFSELWLVSPKADLRDAKRTAMHSAEMLERATIVPSLRDALADTDFRVATTATRPRSEANIKRTFITPKEFALRWSETDGITALIFGREGNGLMNDEIDMCDFVVSIPTSQDYPEMNVSHSVAIILYELFNVGTKHPLRKGADAELKMYIAETFSQILDRVDMPIHRRSMSSRVLRNLLGRSYVSRREATILLGVLRRINSKLQ